MALTHDHGHVKRGPIVPVSVETVWDANGFAFLVERADQPYERPPFRHRLRWWLDDQADRFRAAWLAFRDPSRLDG